ncbi:Holliday junction resolvase RuvX [Pseudohaliea sp.]|uniref:Holliday junction resolvase RuvX n=1 Tax=Pseudohaliea sp. TaxID=2740289 RepID=UPI0032EB0BE7
MGEEKQKVRTLLAFDFGLTQIGVAVGNAVLGTCEPLTVLRAKGGQPNWDETAKLLEEWRPDLLLVGDPLNMDGTPSEIGERARRFARRLHGRFGKPVELVDERLTSHAAKAEARERGHRGDYRKDPVDSLAASLILESWLAGNR